MTKRHGEGHKALRRWYQMPTAVLILGIVSAILLFWVYRIGERQGLTFEQIDAVQDIHIRTATFHLWFEEGITTGSSADLKRSFMNLDAAIKLSDALCCGGLSEHGIPLVPLSDPVLRRHTEDMAVLLSKLREIAGKRQHDPTAGGIGSAFDEQLDAVFQEFQGQARAIELAAERNQMRDQAKTRRLLFASIPLWAFIVAGSATGLYRREFQRRQAELALERAYEEVEQEVKVRTAELENANSLLREEVVERKKTADSLRESESESRLLSLQLHTLLDAIPDGITLLSAELQILWVNGAASIGKVSDAVGRYCYVYRHNAAAVCKECPVSRSLRTGRMECQQMLQADGRTWELRAFPIWGEDGQIENVLEIATDITGKIAMEAEKMRVGRLASLGELAAGVAHEINNPISGIINYAKILANKSSEGGAENDIAERIAKEGRRIAAIVSSLLAFARERKETKMPVSLGNILRDSLTLTESQIRKKGIQLRIDMPPALPEIIANPQQMQQVIINIINNAQYALNLKYPGEHEDKILYISGEEIRTEVGSFVRINFHDHGVGIAPDHIDKIMNPFFSTKPTGEGTGLGLSISHGIVTDHGGRIAVKSVKGEFTKVLIDLPAKESYG